VFGAAVMLRRRRRLSLSRRRMARVAGVADACRTASGVERSAEAACGPSKGADAREWLHLIRAYA